MLQRRDFLCFLCGWRCRGGLHLYRRPTPASHQHSMGGPLLHPDGTPANRAILDRERVRQTRQPLSDGGGLRFRHSPTTDVERVLLPDQPRAGEEHFLHRHRDEPLLDGSEPNFAGPLRPRHQPADQRAQRVCQQPRVHSQAALPPLLGMDVLQPSRLQCQLPDVSDAVARSGAHDVPLQDQLGHLGPGPGRLFHGLWRGRSVHFPFGLVLHQRTHDGTDSGEYIFVWSVKRESTYNIGLGQC